MAMTHLGRRVRERAEEVIRQTAKELGDGGAQDFAEYRYHAGYIAGIKAIIGILEEQEND